MLAGNEGVCQPQRPTGKAGRCASPSTDALVAARAISLHMYSTCTRPLATHGTRGPRGSAHEKARRCAVGDSKPDSAELVGRRACLRGQRADAPVARARVFLGVHLEAQPRHAPRAPHARQLLLRLAAQHQQPRAARLQAAVQVCAGLRELSPPAAALGHRRHQQRAKQRASSVHNRPKKERLVTRSFCWPARSQQLRMFWPSSPGRQRSTT